MQPDDLRLPTLADIVLAPYAGRANDISSQFILWFLENVFRLDEQDAVDAVVDAHMDKGIDAVFSDDGTETVYIFQSKVNSKAKGTIPETDIKDFYASLQQFSTPEAVQAILDGNANQKLKDQLIREKVKDKVLKGFTIAGVFCSNVPTSEDAKSYLKNVSGIEVYDADRICSQYIDIDYDGGIKSEFTFDISGTDIITYKPGSGVTSYIFLARALQLVNLPGIADGTLFERNVRLALGNTKVNQGLIKSIDNATEHRNFPLYHNGINVICDSVNLKSHNITIENFTVVNGAQSLTSLYKRKNKITNDLNIVVKIIALNKDLALADKITNHSNNQNAIKARDLKSNHKIQERLKEEIELLPGHSYFYEVKRQADKVKGKEIIVNEDVGLYILAMDLAQPFSCHQKYRIMDDLHGEIFGRPSVNGLRVVCIHELGKVAIQACGQIDNKPFANYTLTKFFIAHLAWSLLNGNTAGKRVLKDIAGIYERGFFSGFKSDFETLANTVALDLNAAYALAEGEGRVFDYKTKLKSATWCNEITTEVSTLYKKMVLRKSVEPIEFIAQRYLE